MRGYKSRVAQVEEKRTVRSAVVFGGLTILALIAFLALVVYGIPFLLRVTNLFGRNSLTPSQVEKVILATPNIETPPRYVNNSLLNIKGTAMPNSVVKIYFNNSSDETVTDSSGNFSANISLNKGENVIYATTVDSKGNESRPTDKYSVNYINKEPTLTLDSPTDNQNFYGDKQKNIKVSGTTDPGNSVSVNDHVAIVGGDGKFELDFSLKDGDNEIKVVASDPAGNKKEVSVKVVYNP